MFNLVLGPYWGFHMSHVMFFSSTIPFDFVVVFISFLSMFMLPHKSLRIFIVGVLKSMSVISVSVPIVYFYF